MLQKQKKIHKKAMQRDVTKKKMIIKRDEKKKGYGDRRNEKSIIEKKK